MRLSPITAPPSPPSPRRAQLSWYTLSFAGVLINSQIDAAVLGVRGDARHLRPAAALQALLERAGPGLIKLAQVCLRREKTGPSMMGCCRSPC